MAVPAAVLKRVASAVVFVPAFVWALLAAPAVIFEAFVVVLAGAASWELCRMFERAGHRTSGWLAIVAAMVVAASFMVPGRGPVIALTIVVAVTLAAPLLDRSTLSTEPAATTLFAVTYVGWLLGHAILLRGLPDGAKLILLVVGVTWLGESAAYAVGNAIGRHRLAPRVSPGKTVEGAVAQVVLSLIAALALRPWLVPTWSIGQALGAGILLGVVGQVGDLAESVIKRSLGTKDTGTLIPGHGGVLDRLDSLLFNVPLLVYYVTLAESLS